jgi:hypothetical protein
MMNQDYGVAPKPQHITSRLCAGPGGADGVRGGEAMKIDLRPFCHSDKIPICRPWTQACTQYATDGSILIAVDSNCGNTPGVWPPAERVIKDARETRWLQPWPAPDFFEWDGEQYARLGPNIVINPRYYRLISALPGPVRSYQPAPDKPIYFCFASGEGVVMPITQCTFRGKP